MKPVIIFVAGLSAGGILPAIGLVEAIGRAARYSATIARQNEALSNLGAATDRLKSACDRRGAAQDGLVGEMRRGLELRDRLIAQIRCQSLEPSHDR